ncbi:MAG: alanyl-tRNA editing protein [Rhodobacter sp.]|uniref:alanyl-tRNA editing protein n=1 Tax=Pararhodobacter sp. TaxID=2127056 RepID=UPI001DE56FC5|nr:alanyl-tRNA editing protein [Pararhodobacter sp.]MCB1346952.1 alanyl-tRNA editing protein [Paracoccaceae bacterium]MCC0073160.1 alanyl-tRNA editing protein [Rhodobacter sp.]HPD91685.1 alanyl-tRNA editing protein [Pararhodobacter sp.]
MTDDTRPLFREDAYARSCTTTVTRLAEDGGIVVADSVFYPTGGGQPGDAGTLSWDGGRIAIVTTRKEGATGVALIPDEGAQPPAPGTRVTMVLDWDQRHLHMRTHTALHLLSVVIPLPVTGGAIGPGKGRLDFDMPEAPEDKQALEDTLNALIARDLAVTDSWITDAELESNPGLVKTMSVRPPMGQGRVRLVRIGTEDAQVDLQPCGGTHVRHTAEIGRVTLGKIEKKGKQNRRVTLTLA